jgi:putative polyketide hydroxylase
VPVGDGSTLDLLGDGFVLLVGPDGGDVVVDGITTHRVDAPGFADAYGIGPGGASLVRPDGIVAWRSRTTPDAAEVAAVLDRVLSR